MVASAPEGCCMGRRDKLGRPADFAAILAAVHFLQDGLCLEDSDAASGCAPDLATQVLGRDSESSKEQMQVAELQGGEAIKVFANSTDRAEPEDESTNAGSGDEDLAESPASQGTRSLATFGSPGRLDRFGLQDLESRAARSFRRGVADVSLAKRFAEQRARECEWKMVEVCPSVSPAH